MNPLVWLADILGADRYHPSTVALASDPLMKILFASGWLAVFVAGLVIGLALILGPRQSVTLSHRAKVIFGVVFILLGADHLMSAVTIFVAVYRLKVIVLGAAAAVSLTTAVLTVAEVFGLSLQTDEKREGS